MTRKRVWSLDEVQAWFVGRLPDGWFVEAPTVLADREEILVLGRLATPTAAPDQPDDRADDLAEVACRTRVAAFREDSRELRMRIADEAEMLWDRKVSWGASCGAVDVRFTSQSVASGRPTRQAKALPRSGVILAPNSASPTVRLKMANSSSAARCRPA